MSTAVVNPPVTNDPVQHFVFEGVTYAQFVAMTDAWGERSGLRTAFDGARLEIMTASRRHERWKKLLADLVRLMTIHLDIPMESGGNTTFRDRFAERGLEPDDCFWLESRDEILGVDEWVARTHPPPDLAIEIVVTRTVVNRLEIYSKLGVPELWVFDGANLTAMLLTPEGAYQETERSAAFPFLQVSELLQFLTMDPTVGETRILKQFVAWLSIQDFPGASHS
jgi:Uma2 family endonuclease